MDKYTKLLKKLQGERSTLFESYLRLPKEKMMEQAVAVSTKLDIYTQLLSRYTQLSDKERIYLLKQPSIGERFYPLLKEQNWVASKSVLEKEVVKAVLAEQARPGELLIEKVSREWETFNAEMLTRTPEEIIARAGEIAVKEETLFLLNNSLASFSEKEIATLCELERPLETICREYVDGEYISPALMQALEHVAYEELKRQMTQQFLGNPIQFSVVRVYRDEGTECMEQSKLIRTIFLSQRPEVDADFAMVTEDLHLSGEERLGFSINTYVAKEQNGKPAHPATADELQFLKSVFASLSADGKLQLVEAEYFKSKVVVMEEENPCEEDEEMELD